MGFPPGSRLLGLHHHGRAECLAHALWGAFPKPQEATPALQPGTALWRRPVYALGKLSVSDAALCDPELPEHKGTYKSLKTRSLVNLGHGCHVWLRGGSQVPPDTVSVLRDLRVPRWGAECRAGQVGGPSVLTSSTEPPLSVALSGPLLS